jgi:type IV pilus assembly protein PilA
MTETSGPHDPIGSKIPVEAEGVAPGDIRFAYLGGSDATSPRPPLRRVLAWTLGVSLFVILAVLSVIPISMAKMAHHEAVAIRALRTVQQAQLKYNSMFHTEGYACSLTALGGDPSNGPPSPESAQIVEADLASGVMSGYFFEIRSCRKEKGIGVARVTGYRVVALPVGQGKTGHRGFCSDESGNLKFDPEGGDNCTQSLFK